MTFDFITAIFNTINTGLEKFIPDANLRTQAAMELAQQASAQIAGQIQLNLADAQNQSLFVSGWRPAIGWVCGGAFAYTFVIQPLLIFVSTIFGHPLDMSQLPKLEMGELMTVLGGILGLGAMRSFEKVQNVTKN